MNTYAIIEGATVVNVVLWDGDVEAWGPEDHQMAVPVPTDTVVGPGYTYAAGDFTAPIVPGPTTAEMWASHKAQAQAALDASDITAIRCLKSGVAFPATWLAYCQALRAIVAAATGDPTLVLPTAPAYPAGT